MPGRACSPLSPRPQHSKREKKKEIRHALWNGVKRKPGSIIAVLQALQGLRGYQRRCPLQVRSERSALFNFPRLWKIIRCRSDHTHEDADLSLRMLLREDLTCPLHQAKFRTETGKVVSGANGQRGSYKHFGPFSPHPMKVEMEEIYIGT